MSDNENGNSASGAKDGDNIYAGVSNKPIASHTEFGTSQYEADSSDDIALKKVTKMAEVALKVRKQELHGFDQKNFILHQHFIRKDYNACKALIKEMADEYLEMCEYPFYIRGKISRVEGNLREALIWFERTRSVNPQNAVYLREIGRLNFLLGNHAKAAEIFLDAIKLNQFDWKLFYWRAMALYHIKQDSDSARKAQECLLSAPAQRVEILTFFAKLCEQRSNITTAIEAQQKALEMEPENLDVLTNMGLLYARMNNDGQAFAAFGKALSYDPTSPQNILAAGSIIQTYGEHDVALTKYRVAAEKCEYNGPLWNNIGMCFFGKGKHVAAISCLKKANYLCPLEWKICYNLGLIHNAMQQYASAYHFLSSAINLNKRSAMAYMALAVVLTNLDDMLNAKKAYERALQLDKNNTAQIRLNYAIFQAKQKEFEKSAESLHGFYEAVAKESTPSQDILSTAESLKRYLAQTVQCDDATREDTAGEARTSHV